MSVVGLIVIIYLAAAAPDLLGSSYAFLVVFGNCWGLFLIIMFLGYGLVEVPRSFWRTGDNAGMLRRAYVKAVFLEESTYDAKLKLEESIRLIVAA
jgi:hypothetical protein